MTALEEATRLGTQAGKDAASWFFDGNTPEETYRKVLKQLDKGDPEVYDSYRVPNLLNGDYGEEDLARDIGITVSGRLFPKCASAYEEAQYAAFWEAVELAARAHLETEHTHDGSQCGGYQCANCGQSSSEPFTCPCGAGQADHVLIIADSHD